MPAIPFVQARNYTRGRLKKIRLIVVHDMESPEKGDTAEAVANYFAATTRQASAHYCVDNNSVVQCVKDTDTAWAAKGANADGLHIEHAGYARQNRHDWTDPYSAAMLARSAKLAAVKARAYRIPIRRLGISQIRAGSAGFCGHNDITDAYPPGSGHYDPGPAFPWDAYLAMVQAEADALAGKPWQSTRVRATAAALGLAAVVFAGVTQVTGPAPAPKPAPKPVPSSTTITPTVRPTTATAVPRVTVRTTVRTTVTKTVRATVTTRVTTRVTVRPPRVVWRYVLVRPGDTLYALATANGTTVARLRALNPFLDPARIPTGTLVRIG